MRQLARAKVRQMTDVIPKTGDISMNQVIAFR